MAHAEVEGGLNPQNHQRLRERPRFKSLVCLAVVIKSMNLPTVCTATGDAGRVKVQYVLMEVIQIYIAIPAAYSHKANAGAGQILRLEDNHCTWCC